MFNLANRHSKSLQKRMDDLFGVFFDLDQSLSFDANTFGLNVDVEDTEKSYILTADLPGVDKSEIDIDYSNEVLSISVNKKSEKQESGKKYLRRERTMQSLNRQIKLVNGDRDKVNASLKNGILTIEVEKNKNASQAKKIEIKD